MFCSEDFLTGAAFLDNEKTGAFPILVTFRDGRRVRYTSAILPLLEADPAVYEIMHAETGEILFYD